MTWTIERPLECAMVLRNPAVLAVVGQFVFGGVFSWRHCRGKKQRLVFRAIPAGRIRVCGVLVNP